MDRSSVADLIAAIHLVYVITVVGGLAVILLGNILRWRFIRNFWLRAIHLAMILVVVAEALLGITCPLTDWEYELRIAAGQHGASGATFVGRLIHHLIFYNFPPIVFIIGYCLFGLAVLASWILIPPALPWKKNGKL